MPNLMSEQEVADLLRCARSRVKRLRLTGELAYLPGRPVMIDEVDVIAYVQSSKIRAAIPPGKVMPRKANADEVAEINERARKDWMRRKLRGV